MFKRIVWGALILLALGGCRPAALTPSPPPVEALDVEAAASATAAAPTSEPTPSIEPTPLPTLPQPTPTNTLAVPPTGQSPQRIEFMRGAITATASGSLASDSFAEYVLYALGKQRMTVNLITTGGKAFLSIAGQEDGAELLRPEAEAARWTGILPVSQDYLIRVTAVEGSVQYTLEIVIEPRSAVSDEELYAQGCPFTALAEIDVYEKPTLDAVLFGTLAEGEQRTARARTPDGWLGFDPGIAQADASGLDRLRWFFPDDEAGKPLINFDAPCDTLLEVTP